ncbi:Ig family protein [Isosphaera pallida ATCC 43644]|uniref:Ig family protein n=1 Tax=Isosphaera pallida (strain ATCC 43644 / DSM 9630 / IS1B) TaxID=575540 RepID=E8R3L2_ISOPI|nr:Ig family protein [Isosphaera pallida ATCC 43644]
MKHPSLHLLQPSANVANPGRHRDSDSPRPSRALRLSWRQEDHALESRVVLSTQTLLNTALLAEPTTHSNVSTDPPPAPQLNRAPLEGDVLGRFRGRPNTTYEFILFSVNTLDSSQFAQEAQPILSLRLTTNSQGLVDLAFPVPSHQSTGRYFTARAVDPEGRVSDFALAIRSNRQPPPNRPPTLVVPSPLSILDRTPFRFQLQAHDPDLPNDSLTFSFDGPVPAGLNISSNGLLTWTPTPAQADQTYILPLRVTDQAGGFTTEHLVITVQSSNQPPTLVAPVDAILLNESELFTLDISQFASDPDLDTDPDETLVFRLVSQPPAGLDLSQAGRLTWTPHETQGPSTQTLTIQVTDARGLSQTASLLLEVREVNQPPVVQPIPPLSIAEGQPLDLQLVAFDADLPAQTLTFSAVTLPRGAALLPNGRLRWTPDFDQGGLSYQLVGQVNDGVDSTPFTILINVENTNRTPSLTTPSEPFRLFEQQPFSLDLRPFASDPDLDTDPDETLVFRLVSQPPAGLDLSQAGRLTWTPHETQGPSTQTLTIQVTDARGLSQTASLLLEVREVNQPPVVQPIPPLSIAEGQPLDLQLVAFDADLPAQTLTFSAVTLPRGAALLPNGRLRWTPDFDQGGLSYQLVGQVNDGVDSTPFTIQVEVRNVNLPPTLDPIDDLELNADSPGITLPLKGLTSGPPGESPQIESLEFEVILSAPELLSTARVEPDQNGGVRLRLTPSGLPGVTEVRVVVKDDGGTLDGGLDRVERSFQLQINPVPEPLPPEVDLETPPDSESSPVLSRDDQNIIRISVPANTGIFTFVITRIRSFVQENYSILPRIQIGQVNPPLVRVELADIVETHSGIDLPPGLRLVDVRFRVIPLDSITAGVTGRFMIEIEDVGFLPTTRRLQVFEFALDIQPSRMPPSSLKLAPPQVPEENSDQLSRDDVVLAILPASGSFPLDPNGGLAINGSVIPPLASAGGGSPGSETVAQDDEDESDREAGVRLWESGPSLVAAELLAELLIDTLDWESWLAALDWKELARQLVTMGVGRRKIGLEALNPSDLPMIGLLGDEPLAPRDGVLEVDPLGEEFLQLLGVIPLRTRPQTPILSTHRTDQDSADASDFLADRLEVFWHQLAEDSDPSTYPTLAAGSVPSSAESAIREPEVADLDIVEFERDDGAGRTTSFQTTRPRR